MQFSTILLSSSIYAGIICSRLGELPSSAVVDFMSKITHVFSIDLNDPILSSVDSKIRKIVVEIENEQDDFSTISAAHFIKIVALLPGEIYKLTNSLKSYSGFVHDDLEVENMEYLLKTFDLLSIDGIKNHIFLDVFGEALKPGKKLVLDAPQFLELLRITISRDALKDINEGIEYFSSLHETISERDAAIFEMVIKFWNQFNVHAQRQTVQRINLFEFIKVFRDKNVKVISLSAQQYLNAIGLLRDFDEECEAKIAHFQDFVKDSEEIVKMQHAIALLEEREAAGQSSPRINVFLIKLSREI